MMSLLAAGDAGGAPGLYWVWPFAALLLCIALLPLFKRTEHWWHLNRNKLLVSVGLGLITLAYYGLRGAGVHGAEAGPATAWPGPVATAWICFLEAVLRTVTRSPRAAAEVALPCSTSRIPSAS